MFQRSRGTGGTSAQWVSTQDRRHRHSQNAIRVLPGLRFCPWIRGGETRTPCDLHAVSWSAVMQGVISRLTPASSRGLDADGDDRFVDAEACGRASRGGTAAEVHTVSDLTREHLPAQFGSGDVTGAEFVHADEGQVVAVPSPASRSATDGSAGRRLDLRPIWAGSWFESSSPGHQVDQFDVVNYTSTSHNLAVRSRVAREFIGASAKSYRTAIPDNSRLLRATAAVPAFRPSVAVVFAGSGAFGGGGCGQAPARGPVVGGLGRFGLCGRPRTPPDTRSSVGEGPRDGTGSMSGGSHPGGPGGSRPAPMYRGTQVDHSSRAAVVGIGVLGRASVLAAANLVDAGVPSIWGPGPVARAAGSSSASACTR